jgi:hypothetical protein
VDYEERKGLGAVPDGSIEGVQRTYFLFGPVGGEETSGGFWPSRRRPDPSSMLSGFDIQRGNVMKKKIDIAAIPELGTSVGMHGSVKQKEVGGPLCLGVLVAIVMAL